MSGMAVSCRIQHRLESARKRCRWCNPARAYVPWQTLAGALGPIANQSSDDGVALLSTKEALERASGASDGQELLELYYAGGPSCDPYTAAQARTELWSLRGQAGPDDPVGGQLAANKMCPDDLLRDLALSDDPDIHLQLARNRRTPASVLALVVERVGGLGEKLAWEESTLRSVALHRNASVDILRDLANHRLGKVRGAVARNRNCPLDLVLRIASDPMAVACRDAAADRRLSEGMLLTLAQHEAHTVRLQVAKNPSAPPNVIAMLVESHDISAVDGAALVRRYLRGTRLSNISDEAIEALRSIHDRWWELDPDVPEVAVCIALFGMA